MPSNDIRWISHTFERPSNSTPSGNGPNPNQTSGAEIADATDIPVFTQGKCKVRALNVCDSISIKWYPVLLYEGRLLTEKYLQRGRSEVVSCLIG